MKKILFLLIVLPSVLFGQNSYATFSADTTHFYNERTSRKDIFDKIMEAEWKINGQILNYGADPIRVETDNILDTIFYKQGKNAPWDTLICNITQSKNYVFYYNECCGGFNVADDTGEFITGSVQFEIKNADEKKQYLGTLGETGTLIKKTTEILKPGCRSAMSPNSYQVTIQEIEICQTTDSCDEEICLVELGKQELNYGFGFNSKSIILDCFYLPLNDADIHVNYDAKSGKITIN